MVLAPAATSLRLPEGTAFNVTEKAVKKAETLLKDDKDIATYTSYVGQGSPRFWLGLNPQLPNEAFAEIVIVSKDVEARERIKARLEKAGTSNASHERLPHGSGRPARRLQSKSSVATSEPNGKRSR